jgi:RNA polymerase sigma-70 factor (ECF subfamily)
VTLLERPVTETRFDQLFTDHHDAIRRYCRRRLDGDVADDAAADVFVVAWRRLADVPEDELPWLYGVARNVVARTRRSSTRRGRLTARLFGLGAPTAEPPETVVLRNADEQRLLEALARLRPGDQEVLRLKAWEELTHAEISAVLGISVAAVDARASRAMKRLARSYGGDT